MNAAAVRGLSNRSGSRTRLSAAPPPTRPTPNQVVQRLDALREAFSGPYRVDQKVVRVDPQFRMNGGFGTDPKDAVKRAQEALPPKVFNQLQLDVSRVAIGKADAKTLVRVTQALIDAGAHKKFGTGAEAVRKMMWHHGVGMDCSGYTRSALLATRGVSEGAGRQRFGVGASHQGFDPDQLPSFRKVSPEMVRPGDVCKIKQKGGSHKVIVASHDVVPATTREVEVPGHGALPRAFTEGSRIHVFQVDSSWGAGEHGSETGGVGRRVWVYSESRGEWGSYAAGSDTLQLSKAGPYGATEIGFFRPRAEK